MTTFPMSLALAWHIIAFRLPFSIFHFRRKIELRKMTFQGEKQ